MPNCRPRACDAGRWSPIGRHIVFVGDILVAYMVVLHIEAHDVDWVLFLISPR